MAERSRLKNKDGPVPVCWSVSNVVLSLNIMFVYHKHDKLQAIYSFH